MNTLTVTLSTQNLAANINGAHIHFIAPGGDPVNSNGPVKYDFISLAGLTSPIPGSAAAFTFPTITISGLTPADVQTFLDGRAYFNVHNAGSIPNSGVANFNGGQVRGNIVVTQVIPEPNSIVLLAVGGLLPAAGLLRRRGAS